MKNILHSSQINSLEKIYQGKVRDIYEVDKNNILINNDHSKNVKKIIKEYIKYFILTPPNHRTINPLAAIRIEVPKSGCESTIIIGIKIIVTTVIMLVIEFTFSILIL